MSDASIPRLGAKLVTPYHGLGNCRPHLPSQKTLTSVLCQECMKWTSENKLPQIAWLIVNFRIKVHEYINMVYICGHPICINSTYQQIKPWMFSSPPKETCSRTTWASKLRPGNVPYLGDAGGNSLGASVHVQWTITIFHHAKLQSWDILNSWNNFPSRREI